jgi:hypothetical protein
MGQVAERPLRRTARAFESPAKRWRNRWLHANRVVFANGHCVERGERLGPTVFPTRELAEQGAAEWLREFADMVEMCGVTYLGPTPDPDRP